MLVIGAGVTLYEAVKAADQLALAEVNIRAMDPFTIKPLDWTAIQTHSAVPVVVVSSLWRTTNLRVGLVMLSLPAWLLLETLWLKSSSPA